MSEKAPYGNQRPRPIISGPSLGHIREVAARYDRLTYEIPVPQQGTMGSMTKAFADLGATLAYGSRSVEDWRRRCEASLAASRARRGKR